MNTSSNATPLVSDLTPEEAGKINDYIKPELIRNLVQRYSTAPIRSRHIHHEGNKKAVDLLEEDLWGILGKDSVTRLDFTLEKERDNKAQRKALQNIHGILGGTLAEGIVLISAHLDSTAAGEPGYRPAADDAPGADDDASGMAGVVAAAGALAQLQGSRPHREIRFVLFNAEEAGQAGSKHYARRHMPADKPEKNAVFYMDMIGHESDGKPIFELHVGYSPVCPQMGSTVEDKSRKLAMAVEETISPLGVTLSAEVYPRDAVPDRAQGFGDHTSFHAQGIPACMVSAHFFGVADDDEQRDPNCDYHLREDTVDNPRLRWTYAADIARAVAAAAWVTAVRPVTKD